ncbi:DUF6992 family protein [Croceimicrobium hydrocarbonivorans]|uniref:Uncharacterized protein n=1 Tax=Croceimicrobium hydrocarbonivorans TaxID=2761580 RepID=A0A7H0VEN3_9FLAO|nr:hypothetical protein [Croceimicrobium hydrocarbonivorans]QNR24181.1 hypothetical protein H4K34_17700 [Croceimicrobium hydrocarbonivorans]
MEASLLSAFEYHLGLFLLLILFDWGLGILCLVPKSLIIRSFGLMLLAWALVNSLIYYLLEQHHQAKALDPAVNLENHLIQVFNWNIGLDILYLIIALMLLLWPRKRQSKKQRILTGLALGVTLNGLYLLIIDSLFRWMQLN